MAILNIQSASKSFEAVHAVRNLSLTVDKGEIFGLLGHNGAGKTTSIECMLGIKGFDSGTVSILGMDPVLDRKELFMRVGVQFQEASYQEKIKVYELCDLFCSLYSKATDYRELLDEFSLLEKEKAYVSSLSGGQRQKLTVVLALIPNPDILFLDELTTGLDPQARREMWGYITQLKEQGKTIFMTTHYMEEAETLCDRVGLMRRGELVSLGTPADLIEECALDYIITIDSNKRDWSFIDGITEVHDYTGQDSGLEIRTKSGAGLLPVIRAFDERSIPIHSLNMRAPNLDDAYLYLTGVSMDEPENDSNAGKGTGRVQA